MKIVHELIPFYLAKLRIPFCLAIREFLLKFSQSSDQPGGLDLCQIDRAQQLREIVCSQIRKQPVFIVFRSLQLR